MIKKIYLLLIFALSSTILINAQVTTSSITGKVTDAGGAALSGATISLTHEPTGTVYNTVSLSNGNFTIPGMRTGGPYTAKVTYTGKSPFLQKDISLNLGEAFILNAKLDDDNGSLKEVVVTATAGSRRRSDGPSTFVSKRDLDMLPTISRNINDFARLNPIANVRNSNSDGSPSGISFGGQSTRYNQFSIDGANSTDVFGLSSNGTNGGQAGINPIPFESIQEVQVILAPYDVTQGGFTGGGMNAVTKSGTNQFHGSAYGLYQNQGMVGKSMGAGLPYAKFYNKTYGASIGGPIIKNKLFFFVNYEGSQRSQPVALQPGTPGSKVRTSALDSLVAYLGDQSKHSGWSYDPGAYNGINNTREANSVFARIDWNINDKNKLMIRNSYVNGSSYSISDGQSSMVFASNGYTFRSKTNSTVAELNSNISSKLSNMLRLTYTAVRDKRDVGTPFPSVYITDQGAGSIRFGSEYSSQANSLSQNIFTLTDNFNIYKGKHTITVGTNNEFYTTNNVFLQGVFGDYTYSSLANFYNGVINQYQTTYSTKGGSDLANGKIKMGQFGVYAQDKWKVQDNFELTYGVRADIPVYFSKPDANAAFNSSSIATSKNVQNNVPPKSSVLLAPRIGFNWDINNDGVTKIRGGAGIFNGRVPLVWVSNQYSNTGVASIKYTANSAAVLANGITFNPGNPYRGTPTTPPPTEIDVTDRNFQAPRTFRANLAVDRQLGWGLTGTIEGIYTKTIKDILYQDLNLVDPATRSLDMGNGVSRPFYNNQRYLPANYTNVIYLTNTNQGYAYNVYATIRKAFTKGWSATLSYAYGTSQSMNDGTSSTALSNMRYAYNTEGYNHLDLARNNNDLGSRVSGFVAKEFKYANGWMATKVGLFYSGYSGQTFSYLFFGNLTGDDLSTATSVSTSAAASLLYVPTSAANFVAKNFNDGRGLLTPQQQFDDWQAYVNSNPYLKAHLGQNTARNGDRMPWESHFDFKLTQDFYIKRATGNKISLNVNIFNAANLLNKNWGKSYYLSNQYVSPLNVVGYTPTANANVLQPQYTFNKAFGNNQYTGKPWAYGDFTSRWNLQVGVAYTF